jgi:hypothetical protein
LPEARRQGWETRTQKVKRTFPLEIPAPKQLSEVPSEAVETKRISSKKKTEKESFS